LWDIEGGGRKVVSLSADWMVMQEDLCVLGGFGIVVFGVFEPMMTAAGIPVAGQATELVRIGDG
jgi:hypothetical protein